MSKRFLIHLIIYHQGSQISNFLLWKELDQDRQVNEVLVNDKYHHDKGRWFVSLPLLERKTNDYEQSFNNIPSRLTVALPINPCAPKIVATIPLKLDRPPPPRLISVNRSDLTSFNPILIGKLSPTNVTDDDGFVDGRSDASFDAYAQSICNVNERNLTNERLLVCKATVDMI